MLTNGDSPSQAQFVPGTLVKADGLSTEALNGLQGHVVGIQGARRRMGICSYSGKYFE